MQNTLPYMQFFKNNILQGNVATPYRCGGKFNMIKLHSKLAPKSIYQ